MEQERHPRRTLYLSLGASIGDKRATLLRAVERIQRIETLSLSRVSSFYKSAPVGGIAQNEFYNLALEASVEAEPFWFLEQCKNIERELGRAPSPRWSDRVIDIDIIFFGSLVIDDRALIVPHPRYRERAFALLPLLEIAPELVDPESGLPVTTYRDALASNASLACSVSRIP